MRRSFVELHAYDITTHAMVDDGLAVATWRSEGITAGKHRPYRNNYVSLAKVHGGLIERYREYFDPIAALCAFDHRI
jgi:ketosteroid isomerase-like protein